MKIKDFPFIEGNEDTYGLSQRSYNVLANQIEQDPRIAMPNEQGILELLKGKTSSDFKEWGNFGKRSQQEVKDWVRQRIET